MANSTRIPSVLMIETKVVGVSHQNTDGSSRQEIIRSSVAENDPVELVPEPQNPYDKHAVKVLCKTGQQIGYLNKKIAPLIREAILNDMEIFARASWVGQKKIRGVGLKITLVTWLARE